MKSNSEGNFYRFLILLFLVITLFIFSSCELFLLPLLGRTNPNDEGAPFQNLRTIVMSDSEIEIRWDWPVADEEEGIEVPKRVKIERFLKKSDNERDPSWGNPIEFAVDKETGAWPAADFFWSDTDFVDEPTGAGYVYEFSWSYGTTIFSSWYDGINVEASREGNYLALSPVKDGYADDIPSEDYGSDFLHVNSNFTQTATGLKFKDVGNYITMNLSLDYSTVVTHLVLALTTKNTPSSPQPALLVYALWNDLATNGAYADLITLSSPVILCYDVPISPESTFYIDLTNIQDYFQIWSNGIGVDWYTSGFAEFHSSRSEDERARRRLYVQYDGEIDWSGL